MDIVVRSFGSLLDEPLRNGLYKPPEFHGTGTKIVNMGELFRFNDIANQEMKRVRLTENELARFGLRNNDLLFARRSVKAEGSGKCSIVSSPAEPTVFESSIIRARLNPNAISARFLFYYFASPLGRASMMSIVTGAAVSGITGEALSGLKIPVPHRKRQSLIVSLLSQYDDLIENNTRRIRVLEEMARLLYNEVMSVPRLRTQPPLIPLGQTARITMGNAPPSSTYNEERRGLPLHQGVGTFGDHVPRDEVWCDAEKARIAEPLDVLFSVRAPVGRLNTAISRIVVGRGLAAIRRNDGCQSFLYWSLRVSIKEDSMGGGTIFKAVTKDDVHKIELPEPPPNEVQHFEQQAGPMMALIRSLTLRNRALRATRDLLLPRLLSGQLDVSHLPDPDSLTLPASEDAWDRSPPPSSKSKTRSAPTSPPSVGE